MKKPFTLVFGLILLSLLAFVLLYPGLISPQNPYALSLIKFWLNASGALQMATAPYAPGPDHLIGSDQLGRDLLSFLAYGTRLTLGLALGVMFGRMALAVPIGILAGMGGQFAQRSIDRFNLVLTTIPPLLIAIIVLRIDLFTSLHKAQSIGIFIVTLSLLGWSKLAAVVHKSTEQIMSETYILSERAIGKSNLGLIVEHLLPHLLPELLILSVMEIAAALTLLMQLGIFSIFVGNLKIIKDSFGGGYSYFNVSFEPEWSSLLGSARDYIRVAPWIALSAGFMFFYTVFAFNLVGEGLRQYHQAQSTATSPQKPSLGKRLALGLALIALVALSLWRAPVSYEQQYSLDHFKATTQSALVDEIQAALQQEGLVPLGSSEANDYRQVFDKSSRLETQSSTVQIDGKALPADAFRLLAGSSQEVSGRIIDATELVFDQSPLNGLCLWVDTDLIGLDVLFNNAAALKKRGASAIIVSDSEAANGVLASPLVVLKMDKSRFQWQQTCTIQLKGTAVSAKGYNFAGTIKGSEPTLAHNQVILLMNYHSLSPETENLRLSSYLNLIHNIAKHRQALKRSVSVILTDGDEGLYHYADHSLIQNKNVNVVLDLRTVDGMPYDQLAFSDTLSPVSRYYGYVFAQQFKRLAKPVLAPRPAPLTDEDAWLFNTNGLTTLVFKASPGEKPSADLNLRFLKAILMNGR